MAAEHGTSTDLARLVTWGRPGGVSIDEALRLFIRLRSTPEEGAAIEALLGGESLAALSEPLLVALGSALIERGEDAAAARVLASASSPPAVMMRSDLLARAGDLAAAVASVERVLLRDIDWPGARDRHARWRDALGVAEQPVRADASATVARTAPGAPFRLLREVGRGGAGAVYEAEDRELGRHVALKIYHHPDRDRSQLLHEARVATALSGPGIVRVFDVDPQHGWLVMEWAPLGTLRSLLLSPRELVPIDDWALPLARTLARVHEAGWVHHDVKPANVLLRAKRAPLLSDFGTARRMGEPSPPGSLGYVSPERLAGRSSDPRDDVYGLGRVIEEALEALGSAMGTEEAWPWRALAVACTGADESRPAEGREVLLVLEKAWSKR